MIIRARTVVPIEGEPISDGAVVVIGDRISEVGRFADLAPHRSGDVLDLGEHALLPGLINAHCHLDYTVLRGKIARQESFAGWIRAINVEKAKLTKDDYIRSIHDGFAEAARFGTTTIANLTAMPELVPRIESPLRTWWFGELIDVRNPNDAGTIVTRAVASLKNAPRWGLAPHAPYTASEGLYAACEAVALGEDCLLTTHLAESHEEMLMFRDGAGAVFDFLQSIGRPIDDCGRETPVARFLGKRALSAQWIVAHLNELGPGDLNLLRDARKFHVAHCPRSHTFFGHADFAREKLENIGLNICLGTDSLASNSDLSLFAEMRELLKKDASASPRKALEMATVDGATALGQRGQLGSIKPGALADLIAVPSRIADVFEEIITFTGEIPWMMLNGRVRQNGGWLG